MDFTAQKIWGNPKWSTEKKSLVYAQSVFKILGARGSVNMDQISPSTMVIDSEMPEGRLGFKTSGTTGKPKQIIHTINGLEKAYIRLREFLGTVAPFNAVSCLPIFHIGGWMQVMRSFFSEGEVYFINYRDFKLPELSSILSQRFVSLVPAQLFELLKSKVACRNLRLCRGIFLGGAESNHLLLARAREEELPLLSCYGLTETAGMVTILKTEDFMNGIEGVGKVMPDVLLRRDSKGRICIKCKSLSGPEAEKQNSFSNDWFTTSDVGHCNHQGYWQISHRIDRVINSGGKKVFPEVVEKKILSFPEVKACRVSHLNDLKWGQKIIALVSPSGINTDDLDMFLRKELEPFQVPKEYIVIDEIPLDFKGK
jgi:o-succinylbenzoate---CoA ligase